MKRTMAGLVAAVLLAALAAATPVMAAQNAAAAQPFTIGMVDTSRIGGEYKAMQQLNEEFQEFQRQQEAKLSEQAKTRMLLDAERQQFLDLSQVGAPTEENKKKMAQLEQTSTARELRLNELEKNKSRTPDEQKEYEQLNSVYSARMADLSKLQSDLQQTVLAKRDQLQRTITDSVNVAIKAVAEQRRLSLVLPKEAVLYGGTDITEDVLAKLNAGPVPTLSASPAAAPAAKTPTTTAPAPKARPVN